MRAVGTRRFPARFLPTAVHERSRAGSLLTTALVASALLVPTAAVTASAGTQPTTSAAVAAATTGGGFLKIFTPENENPGHTYTREQAVAAARTFSVIAATPNAFTRYVADMRAANPSLSLLVYMNGTFAQKSEGTKYPDSWYARDARGAKVRSIVFGNYLMRPDVQGWVDTRISLCRSLLTSTRYDGCMVDMLSTAPVQAGYVTALPVNPATGQVWLPSAWQRAMATIAQKIDAGVSTGTIWGNGFSSGPRYYDSAWGPSSVLNSGVVGALAETWIRTSRMGVTEFRSEADWKRSVDMLVDLGRIGERSGVMVKLWCSGTTAQKDAYHRYSLASFLLGSNGASSFNISYGEGTNVLAGHRYWNLGIGTPTGAYTKVGAAYRRAFTKGLVLANPTKSTVTVALGATYTSLDGARMTSVTLRPNTGDVFTRVA